MKIKILIYNHSIFPAGMGKDNLSELICAQILPTKPSVSASNGQAAPPAFAGCPVHLLPFPQAPLTRPTGTGTSAWADVMRTVWAAALPGPVQGHWPAATLNVDSGHGHSCAGGHQAGLGAPSHPAAPRPKAPCSPRGRPLDSIPFCKLL